MNNKILMLAAMMAVCLSFVAIASTTEDSSDAADGNVFELKGSFTIGETYSHVPIAFGTGYTGNCIPGMTLAAETIDGFDVITISGSPTRSHCCNIGVKSTDGVYAYVQIHSAHPGGSFAAYDVLLYTFVPGTYYNRMISAGTASSDSLPGLTFYTQSTNNPNYPTVTYIRGTPTQDNGNNVVHISNTQTTAVFTTTPALSVTITAPTTTIGIGETVQLSATAVSQGLQGVDYVSYKSSVASVKQSTGLVTGVSPGIATIMAVSKHCANICDTIEISVGSFYKYDIVYDLNGSDSYIWPYSTTSQSSTLSYKITSAEPVLDGYRFLGWGSSPNSRVVAYEPGGTYTFNPGTTTLYAIWSYDILLTPTINSGYTDFTSSVASNFSVISGASICTSQKINDTTFRVTPNAAGTIKVQATNKSDSTSYATSTIFVSSVIYDANGGTGAPSTQLFTQSDDNTHTFVLSTDYPTRTESSSGGASTTYTCMGWGTTSTSDSPIRTLEVRYNQSKTVYAIWTSDTVYSFTIEYDLNGGTGSIPSTTASGTSQTKTLTVTPLQPSKEGMAFMGWTANQNGTGTLYRSGEDYMFSYGTTTLYAKYNEELVITTDPIVNGHITYSNTSGIYVFEFTSDTEGIRSVLWEFGDGKTSTDEVAYHGYSEVGTYDVKLTVQYENDSTAEWEQTLDVTNIYVETEQTNGGINLTYVVIGIVVIVLGAFIVMRFI